MKREISNHKIQMTNKSQFFILNKVNQTSGLEMPGNVYEWSDGVLEYWNDGRLRNANR
jgi:hypothetical protein